MRPNAYPARMEASDETLTTATATIRFDFR